MRVHQAGFTERPITFGYDFRMRCEHCGQASTLNGTDYVRLEDENDSLMDCEHCGQSTRFGPLASAIRDEDDPTLDDTVLNTVSWYHTSTYADWPSNDYQHDLRTAFSASRVHDVWGDSERYVQDRLDKALHLGTYEAAVENMYRHMRDQRGEHSTFYLHRVRINVAPARVNPGYRDETNEAAANISITELTAGGLDTVRYLNVWEAWGSISLAVRPEVISDVQTIPIPSALGPVSDVPSPLSVLIQDLERRDEAPATPEERELRSYDLAQELEYALIARFLPEVNFKVAREFARAVAKAHGRIGSDFRGHARLFADQARLLYAPEQVLALLNAAPSQRPDLA